MGKRVLSSFILLCAILLSREGALETQDITVTNAWARPGKTGGNPAIYLTITNALPEADTQRLALDFHNRPILPLMSRSEKSPNNLSVRGSA